MRCRVSQPPTCRSILQELTGRGRDSVWLQPPFYCDYGTNIFNCVVLDVCPMTVGDFTLFGPAVQIYTATLLTRSPETCSL